MTTRATECSTPLAELQVSVPSERGRATLPKPFRPRSPVTTRNSGGFKPSFLGRASTFMDLGFAMKVKVANDYLNI